MLPPILAGVLLVCLLQCPSAVPSSDQSSAHVGDAWQQPQRHAAAQHSWPQTVLPWAQERRLLKAARGDDPMAALESGNELGRVEQMEKEIETVEGQGTQGGALRTPSSGPKGAGTSAGLSKGGGSSSGSSGSSSSSSSSSSSGGVTDRRSRGQAKQSPGQGTQGVRASAKNVAAAAGGRQPARGQGQGQAQGQGGGGAAVLALPFVTSFLALPALSDSFEESLGAPCSGAWLQQSGDYLTLRWPALSNSFLLSQYCDRLSRLAFELGLLQCWGRGGWRAQCVREEWVVVDPNLALHRLLSHSDQLAQIRSDWGDCWPSQLPLSPLLKMEDLSRRSGRYLVVAHTHEDLLKNRLHFTEALRLANMSHRIAVLPRASDGVLSMGGDLPLCHYFSLDQLTKQGLLWISPDVLCLLLMRHLRQPHSTAVLCVGDDPFHCANTAMVARAMAQTVLGFAQVPKGATSDPYWVETLMPSVWANSVTSAQKALTAWSDVNIVLYIKFTPMVLEDWPQSRPTPALAQRLLPVTPRLCARVDAMLSFLGPSFVALSLRFASLLQQHLVKSVKEALVHIRRCTEHAVELTQRALRESGAEGVYLAVDVPRPDYGPLSLDLLKNWDAVTEAFGKDETLHASRKWFNYVQSHLPHTYLPEQLDKTFSTYSDLGEAALVEYGVIGRAAVFVAGAEECGGGHFSVQGGIQERQKLGRKEPLVLRYGGPK